MDPKACSGADLARAFGVDRALITRWKRAGLPHRSGVFDLPTAIKWKIDREVEALAPTRADEVGQEWLNRYRRERALLARLQRRRVRGDLVPVPEVLKVQAEVAGRVKNAMRALCHRLPPQLAGKTEEDMLPIIRAEVDQALLALAADLLKRAQGERKTKRPSKAGKGK